VTGPVLICAQAGEVNTGAFDPFPAIGEWARRHQAWMHVDGAFGLWAMTDLSRSHLTVGLASADSWATDGHRWLNRVCVRDPGGSGPGGIALVYVGRLCCSMYSLMIAGGAAAQDAAR
jgi:cysteine sulfinate desulfinase/cysteine desulfurase-like protein